MTRNPFPFFAILATVACVALVGTIEGLNVQARDAIGVKQEFEPQSKWRTGHPAFGTEGDGKKVP